LEDYSFEEFVAFEENEEVDLFGVKQQEQILVEDLEMGYYYLFAVVVE
jgi:hypothetical protein